MMVVVVESNCGLNERNLLKEIHIITGKRYIWENLRKNIEILSTKCRYGAINFA